MECSINEKEVRFDLYCEKCKHGNVAETEEPCNECLTYPFGLGSVKPFNFEEEEI